MCFCSFWTKTTILEIAFEFYGVFLYCFLTHPQLICHFIAPGDFVEKGLQQWAWKKSLKIKKTRPKRRAQNR
jgi:hypothetical protein